MHKRRAFTLIELLVVIAIIALLMSILMPALQRVRKQSKEVVCRSNLRHWGLIWSMYCSENKDKFMKGGYVSPSPSNQSWVEALRPYYSNPNIRVCPTATKPVSESGGSYGTFTAWGIFGRYNDRSWGGPEVEGDYGSYGINEFAYDSLPFVPRVEQYWRTVNVKGRNNIPLFLDCVWFDVWTDDTNPPPAYYGDVNGEMKTVCINRHDGYINCLFFDWSTRKVGLKELWTLKWHKSFNTAGPYTLAGGVQAGDWPDWMRSFKEY